MVADDQDRCVTVFLQQHERRGIVPAKQRTAAGAEKLVQLGADIRGGALAVTGGEFNLFAARAGGPD